MTAIPTATKDPTRSLKLLREAPVKLYEVNDEFIDDLRRAVDWLEDAYPRTACLVEFLLLTGMRIGEALGLKRSEISFGSQLATIKRTRATHGGASKEDYEGDVKNMQSYRTIKLSAKALLLIQEELEINQHHIIGNPDYKDKGWIFTSKSSNKSDYNGTPLHYSVINNFLNSSETGKITKTGHVKKVGINIDNRLSFNKHISTHIFRHTFVSHMAEQGVPLIAVQRYIGHKSGSKITEEIYTHITKKMSDTITESIDTLID